MTSIWRLNDRTVNIMIEKLGGPRRQGRGGKEAQSIQKHRTVVSLSVRSR